MVARKKEGGMDSAKHEVAREVPICPTSVKKLQTSAGATAGPVLIGDFVAPTKKNIHIRGYVDFYGGYANHCREVVFGLGKSGKYNVKLTPIPSPIDIDPTCMSDLNQFIYNDAYRKDGDFLVVAGPGHLQKKLLPNDGRRVVGWTMIETLGVQDRIVRWCNNADLILCPTEIDYMRFSEAGVDNLEIVPIGYDPKSYNPEVKPMDIINVRKRYVFGVVGSWNHRKGVEEIVHAYCMAFNSEDPVSLMLVCKYGNRPYGPEAEESESWGIRKELKACLDKLHIPEEKKPHICVVDVPLHPSAMPHLYSRIDCLVGFSSGESTWLPGIELGAMKKPIIQLKNKACGYMDYLHNTRYLCNTVHYKECGEELYLGTSEYYEGEKMGFGQALELSEMMIRVYEESGSGVQKKVVNEVYKRVKERTWENSVEILMSTLNS